MSETLETPESAPGASGAWKDTTVFGIGGWLLLCPMILDLNSSAVDMFVTVGAGVVMAGLAAIALSKDRPWVEGALVAWGAILAALPWLLGFVLPAAVINAVTCGALTAALAAWRVYDLRVRPAAEPAASEAANPAAAADVKRRAA
jgi:hypothetical protein